MVQAPASLTLFHSPNSRSRVAVWMLEEIGIPYERQIVDIRTGAQKSPEYLAINPMGKVPALRDGDVVVTEYPAISLYLADKYAGGKLAPAIASSQRGEFLRWMFFAGSCIEPALVQHWTKWELPPSNAAWGSYDQVIDVLSQAVAKRPYLLGDSFTAADVVVGAGVNFGLDFKLIQDQPVLEAYSERLKARPAFKRSIEIDAASPSYNPAS